jgi:BRCT domain type II-containing protein
MIGLQLIAKMNIGGGQKKQSDAKSEKKQVKHECLLEESHSNDAQ